jgi:hypothetical protein
MVPEIDQVDAAAVPVKLTSVTLALLTVADRFVGVNVYPASAGTIVWLPLVRPAIVYAPSPPVVADASPAETVTPATPESPRVTVPEIDQVDGAALAVKLTSVTLSPLTVTNRLAGASV